MNCQKCDECEIVSRHPNKNSNFTLFKYCAKYEILLGPSDIYVVPCEACLRADGCHE